MFELPAVAKLYRVKGEPYFEPVTEEIALIEVAYNVRMPVLINQLYNVRFVIVCARKSYTV